jgi:hypothetical protein
MTVQPSFRPAAPAMNTAVSSSRPCGRISPQNFGNAPATENSPAANPTLAAFCTRMNPVTTQTRMPAENASTPTRRLFVNTLLANCADGSAE